MKLRNLSQSEQNALNIIGSIIVVIINTLINLFLSPYIVTHMGVEANGYMMLANNIVSYFVLITTALNSMAGRFILIELRKNNLKEANEYYSSVLFGDWILAAILLLPCVILIVRLENFIQVSSNLISDVRILFSLVFVNFFIGLCIPKWNAATYSTNKLYLRSFQSILSAVTRALVIYFSYKLFHPHVFYVAIAGIVMTLVNTICEYLFKIKILPQLKVKIKYYNLMKIKELISSGIWNAVSQCGNLLLEGLDILIANLFINPTASGIFALTKIIPNMINQISGNIGTTFGPTLTYLYADGRMREIKYQVQSNIKVVSILVNMPIGITFAFGAKFFHLWVPSQDSHVLVILSSLTLIGMLVTGISSCILNIFTVVNKLRINSWVVILSGLLNVLVVYITLKTTGLGVYAIAGVSSFISITRIFVFTAPYAAHCIDEKWYVFHLALIKGSLNVLFPTITGLIVVRFITAQTWFSFFTAVAVTSIITIAIDYFIVLNKQERKTVLNILHIMK